MQTAATSVTARIALAANLASSARRGGPGLGSAEHERGANRLRHALQADEQRKDRDQGLEQIDERQSAGFARAFQNRPGAFRVGDGEHHKHGGKRQKKEYGAKQVNQGAGPGLRLRVENIDTNVTIG